MSLLKNDIIQNKFNLSCAIVLTIIGLIGNSIVFYIFTRPKFLKVSFFRYLIFETILYWL